MTIEEALQRCVDASTISPVQAYLGAGVRVAARTAIILPVDLWEDLVRAIDEDATSSTVGVLRVELGPLRLAYYPDGDDPGVGAIELQIDEAKARTPFVVPIETWREITKIAARSARALRELPTSGIHSPT